MANVAVTNTFAAGTNAVASQVNTNFTDLVTYINNRNGGSATWDSVQTTSTSNVPLVCNNSTGTQNIANFQDNGTNCMVIADGGAVSIANATGTVIPLTISNGTSTGDILKCQDNSTAVFRVVDGGNVAIGLSGNPGCKLHIATGADGTADGNASLWVAKNDIAMIGNEDTANSIKGYFFSGVASGTGVHVGSITAHSVFVKVGGANKLSIDTNGSVCVGTTASFGSGQGVVFISNAGVNPSTNPSGGGVLYVDSGVLKYRGSSGTVTTLGNA